MSELGGKDQEIIALIQAIREQGKVKRFPWEMLVALVAVVTLGINVSQSWTTTAQTWAVMGKRIDDLESARTRTDMKLESVPELKWNIDAIKNRLDGIEKGLKENTTTLTDLRDTIQAVGLRKTPR